MKNFLVFSFLLLAGLSSAQNTLDPGDYRLKKNELYASYSPPFFSGTELGVTLTYAILEGFFDAILSESDEEDYSSFGTAHVGYNRFLSHRFSLGFEVQYNRMVIDGSSEGVLEYSYRLHLLQPQIRFDYRYISKPKFQMYSGGAVGLMFSKEHIIEYNSSGAVTSDESYPWAFNSGGIPFHINLAGFRFGRQTAFFTELGIGFNSLVRVGVSSRF